MIPHHVYYQLAVLEILWVCILLHDLWPSRGALSPQLPVTNSVHFLGSRGNPDASPAHPCSPAGGAGPLGARGVSEAQSELIRGC
jgi:hypothetical protein